MSVIIVATAGAANANSYGTEEEADLYFESRLPLDPPWDQADDPSAALVMATRVLEGFAAARKRAITIDGKRWFVTSRAWTGAISTSTQSLSWPRTGMLDRLGRAIPVDAIPQDLKNAQFELAGQLVLADRTLDNEVTTAGLTSVRAGSVALTFKDMIERQVLPEAVMDLLVPSWLTDEILSSVLRPDFRAL